MVCLAETQSTRVLRSRQYFDSLFIPNVMWLFIRRIHSEYKVRGEEIHGVQREKVVDLHSSFFFLIEIYGYFKVIFSNVV